MSLKTRRRKELTRNSVCNKWSVCDDKVTILRIHGILTSSTVKSINIWDLHSEHKRLSLHPMKFQTDTADLRKIVYSNLYITSNKTIAMLFDALKPCRWKTEIHILVREQLCTSIFLLQFCLNTNTTCLFRKQLVNVRHMVTVLFLCVHRIVAKSNLWK